MRQFNKLNTKSVADTVSEQIQYLVLGGGLKPGEKLPSERFLSAEFNVSRMSLRQGIAQLVKIDLLVTKKDGTYICDAISPSLIEPFSQLFNWYPKALNDMLDLRLLLEEEALKLSIRRIGDSDKRIISKFYEKMQSSFITCENENVSHQQLMVDVDDFHLALIDSSYNLAIATVLRGILSLFQNSFTEQTHIDHLNEFQFIQERLYKAVIESDVDLSKKMLRRHIEFVKALYQDNNSSIENSTAGNEESIENSAQFRLDKTISRIEYLLICGHFEANKAMPSKKKIAELIKEDLSTVEKALTILLERGQISKSKGRLLANDSDTKPLINDPLVHLMQTDRRIAYNVLELRILLEQNSAFEAAKNDSTDKRVHLKNCLDRLLAQNKDFDADSNAIDDYEFHFAIADMSENLATSYLMRGLFNLLRTSISSWLELFKTEVGDISIIQSQHIDICDAILASKPDAAKDAMLEHLQYVIITMKRIYEYKEREMYADLRWRYLDNKKK